MVGTRSNAHIGNGFYLKLFKRMQKENNAQGYQCGTQLIHDNDNQGTLKYTKNIIYIYTHTNSKYREICIWRTRLLPSLGPDIQNTLRLRKPARPVIMQ